MLADDDSRERCVTCIRLKKTCAFHPPDRQHSYTGRFETFDTTRPTAGVKAAKSLSFAGQNTGRALNRAEQLESYSTPSSIASLPYTDSWFGPWTVLPNSLEYGISAFDFENGSTLPFDFHPGLTGSLEAWNRLDSLSSGGPMDRGDHFSHSRWLSNVAVPREVCTQFPGGNAAVWLPPQSTVSAS